MSSEVRSCLVGHQITPLVTKFNTNHLFLNWYHLWQTSQKKYFNTDALWGSWLSGWLIYISPLTYSRKTQKKFQDGCHLSAVSVSFTKNISLNDPIGDQLQHGWFLQITLLLTNFNMDHSILNWDHLRETSQKKSGWNLRMPYESRSCLIVRYLFLHSKIQGKNIENILRRVPSEVCSCLIGRHYFFKWTHWWPASTWTISSNKPIGYQIKHGSLITQLI